MDHFQVFQPSEGGQPARSKLSIFPYVSAHKNFWGEINNGKEKCENGDKKGTQPSNTRQGVQPLTVATPRPSSGLREESASKPWLEYYLRSEQTARGQLRVKLTISEAAASAPSRCEFFYVHDHHRRSRIFRAWHFIKVVTFSIDKNTGHKDEARQTSIHHGSSFAVSTSILMTRRRAKGRVLMYLMSNGQPKAPTNDGRVFSCLRPSWTVAFTSG